VTAEIGEQVCHGISDKESAEEDDALRIMANIAKLPELLGK
jgi:hypothetical protein